MRKTATGWFRPEANSKRSSWVNVSDGSWKTIVAELPANGSWVNVIVIASGYVLGLDVVGDIEDPGSPTVGTYARLKVGLSRTGRN